MRDERQALCVLTHESMSHLNGMALALEEHYRAGPERRLATQLANATTAGLADIACAHLLLKSPAASRLEVLQSLAAARKSLGEVNTALNRTGRRLGEEAVDLLRKQSRDVEALVMALNVAVRSGRALAA